MAKPRATAPSHTAKVLPEPVVACSRPERPSAIAAHTSRWNVNEDQPPGSEPTLGRFAHAAAVADHGALTIQPSSESSRGGMP